MTALKRPGADALWGAAAAAFFALLFAPALRDLLQVWLKDPDNSHGLLVPLASAALLVRDRRTWLDAERGSSATGLALLAGALLLHLLSLLGGIVLGQRLALVAAINGAALYNGGGAVYRRMRFPLLFLFFMIPLPDALHDAAAFPLQLFATAAARTLLARIGVPVLRAGNLLRLPGGTLEVAEACSGIRSLAAFLTIAVFFARPLRAPAAGKAMLVLSALPIALGANVLRITASGLLAFVYGLPAAEGFLHQLSGFALFLFGLGAFFLEARILEDQALSRRERGT